MLHTFYLKKVVVYLENVFCIENIKALVCKLTREGIECNIYPPDRLLRRISEEMEADNNNPDDNSGVLVLTDNLQCADKLSELGIPMIVYLHPGNENLEFTTAKYAVEYPQELDGIFFENVYRRFHRIPWTVMETKRCYIRETTEEDVEFFYDIYSHPDIVKYMENLYPTIQQEKQYIREYIDRIYAFYGFGVWTIVRKEDDEVIGRAGFCGREGYEDVELGFIIGVPWQRQGYAEEVCGRIMEYGWEELGFESIRAMVHPKNKASIHLCLKLGFVQKGIVEEGGDTYALMQKSRKNT